MTVGKSRFYFFIRFDRKGAGNFLSSGKIRRKTEKLAIPQQRESGKIFWLPKTEEQIGRLLNSQGMKKDEVFVFL